MAELPRNLINEINRVLSSIRGSFDAGNLSRSRIAHDLGAIRKAYFSIEEIRFNFRAGTSKVRTGPDNIVALRELTDRLLDLSHDEEFMGLADSLRYRPTQTFGYPRDLGVFHPALTHGRISAGEAVNLFINALHEASLAFRINFETLTEKQGVEALRRVIPRQKLSPVHFDIVNQRLVIAPQIPKATGGDSELAGAARQELLARGETLIDELTRSNCDRRLLENVQGLQEQLSQQTDVVRLGVANLACRMMSGAFEEELPEAIAAMLQSQTLGISMYVAQFPEWTRFSENAAQAEFDEQAIRIVQTTATRLAEQLEAQPELADAEVPRVIRFLTSLTYDPHQTTKRAAFAVLRTIENLVIRVYQYGADFLDSTARKTSEALSSATAKIIVAALLSVAVTSAAGLSPVALSVEGIAWLKEATEIVARQLQSLL